MHLNTHSGKKVDLMNFRQSDIDFDDICHALANINRFGGHGNRFYSVADHTLNLARYFTDITSDMFTKYYVKCALVHDMSEAYLGDVVSPLKNSLPEYSAIESTVQRSINNYFFGTTELPPVISLIDKRIAVNEGRALGLNIPGAALSNFKIRFHANPKKQLRQKLKELFNV